MRLLSTQSIKDRTVETKHRLAGRIKATKGFSVDSGIVVYAGSHESYYTFHLSTVDVQGVIVFCFSSFLSFGCDLSERIEARANFFYTA